MNSETGYGITVLYQPANLNDVLYDLVAVHGLNGDAFETWTSKRSRVMWLRDFLPKELPNVRIMTYGYNAKFRDFTGHQDLRNISMKLLSELVDLRKNEKEVKRPLIFVCHSLGGIVVKKSLLIRCPAEQTKVQNATYGIMFLATPHSGTAVANSGKIIANIVAACSPFKPARSLLGLLRKDSKVLFEITEEFVEKVEKLQIVSFFEMKKTSFTIFKRIVVEQHSATLNVPNEIPIGQFADHRDIARFFSVEDRNYRPVIGRLLKFGQDITKKLSLLASPRPPQTPKVESDAIFEVPFDRCVTSRGRERLLESMDSYFNQPNSNRQLVYALTGLGGSGKTHSALQYALRNRFKYKSGVVYFNATSNTTLITDFHRIFDLLDLGNASNKIDSLKKWFSKSSNRNWLMIFDGADDLESVPISRYFPNCPWGHIIITSRDQAAVGLVAPAGQAIEPLEEDAAVGVLLEKAAIADPSDDDLEQAGIIVNLLGYLPLAVDQAGALIRRRQKSLKDYHRLFEDKKYEVLSVTPGIGGYDMTVAAVWELNFRQLEKDAPEASHLLMILSFLEGGDIPESMLCRGFSSKRIWGRNGEVADMTAKEAGLDPEMIALFDDEMRLDRAIEQLLAFSLIQRNNLRHERRVFSVHPLVQHCASHRVSPEIHRKWQIQAILLIAHAFPFSHHIEEDFFAAGREMFAHVPRILREFDQLKPDCDQYSTAKEAVCALLLSGIKFEESFGKRDYVRRFNDLLKDDGDPYLKALAAELESRHRRNRRDIAGSYKVLEELVRSTVQPGLSGEMDSDVRWHAGRGRLILSLAENLIKDNDHTGAQAELEGWKPFNSDAPSTMEKIVLRDRNIMLGRIVKNQGRFSDALPYFEEPLQGLSLENCRISTGWQIGLFAHISDLYCEVGRPDDAEAVLKKELDIFCAHGWRTIITGRRLQLSLIETFIRRGMFERAEECLLKLIPVFEEIAEPNILQSTAHFRVWVGLARVSHLQDHFDTALARWNRALGVVEASGWTTGFSHGIILYSIAQVLFRLGKIEESHSTLEKAQKSLASEKRKYWIVGLGSYWYEYIVTTIGEVGPNPIVTQSEEAIVKDYDHVISRFFGSDETPDNPKKSDVQGLGFPSQKSFS